MKATGAPTVLTVGHSTYPIQEFVEMLQRNGVERLIDIRTIPRSRHNPQFNKDSLAELLESERIGYTHLKDLGGLRHPRKDSVNTGWRNASFRGYADYMQTPEFEDAVRRLLQLCAEGRCAVMCAEAVPWRCHRSLLADALTARGVAVEHILGGGRREAHRLTPFARIEGGKVNYPGVSVSAVRDAASGQGQLEFGETTEDVGEAAMPRKKRKTKFTAAKETKRQARLAVGPPPAERVIPDKRRKAPKHKKTFGELAENAE